MQHVQISLSDLGLVLCRADTKRKLIKPIYDKVSLYSVEFLYYAGYILRDINNPKKYYSIEDIKEKVLCKLSEVSIEI